MLSGVCLNFWLQSFQPYSRQNFLSTVPVCSKIGSCSEAETPRDFDHLVASCMLGGDIAQCEPKIISKKT